MTQLPQHLPRQIYGLVNSYILHKITDPQVVRDLQRTVSGIDESLWGRLTGLGQARPSSASRTCAAAAGGRGPGPVQAADGGLKHFLLLLR